MNPFKGEGQHSISELLYNHKHKIKCLIVKNVFDIFKKTFQESQAKFDLHVSFLLDSLFIVNICTTFSDFKMNQTFKG